MIIEFSELSRLRKRLAGKKIVFAGGVFDILHRGHIEYFRKLREHGDLVVIALSTDKRVQERKGPHRPILHQKDRLALVDAIRYVDYSLLAPEPRPNKSVPTMRILEILKPDVFVTIDKRWESFRKNIERLGVKLRIISPNRISSTTRIINKILANYTRPGWVGLALEKPPKKPCNT